MKKIVSILFLFLVITSCSVEDDSQRFHSVLVPAVEVEVPEEFTMGETYTIKVWYNKLSTCHNFNGFYYDKYLNERTIAVQNLVQEKSDCQDLEGELVYGTFDFVVTSNGSYVFKFWSGTDQDGQDTFIEIEIPVVN